MRHVMIINNWATNKGDRSIITFLVRELARAGVEKVTVSTTIPEFWTSFNGYGAKVAFVPFGWNEELGGRDVDALATRVKRRLVRAWYHRVHFPVVRDAVCQGRRDEGIRRRGCKAFTDALAEADLVVSTGGHHITSMRIPDSIWSETYDMGLAVLSDAPFVLWSQTIGPLTFHDPRNRAYIREVIDKAAAVYLRDRNTDKVLQDLGVRSDHVHHTHDSVFGLHDLVRPEPPTKRANVVGVSIFTGNARTPEARQAYVETLGAALRDLVARGFRIRFFAMEYFGDEGRYLADIIAQAGCQDAHEIIPAHTSAEDHIRLIAECRLFIGHKTHSVIYSLTSKTPVVAIAYHQKTQDFMDGFGLGRLCLPDAELGVERLQALIEVGLSEADALFGTMAARMDQVGPQVQADFQDMLKAMKTMGRPAAAPAL